MVGGYQLLSLKDYVFDLSGGAHSTEIDVEPKDIDMFKNLLNNTKPIICKDIIIKFSDTDQEIFDNIILSKCNKTHVPYDTKQIEHSLNGIIFDGAAFLYRYASFRILFYNEGVALSISTEEDL